MTTARETASTVVVGRLGLHRPDGHQPVCETCRFYRADRRNWGWDRCEHPSGYFGHVFRGDDTPLCATNRRDPKKCGQHKWYEPRQREMA